MWLPLSLSLDRTKRPRVSRKRGKDERRIYHVDSFLSMEGFGGSGFTAVSSVTKKRRSETSRRPRPGSHFLLEGRDTSSYSLMPSLDNGSKFSPDQNLGYDSYVSRKEFNLNSSAPRIVSVTNNEGMGTSRKIRKEDGKYGELSGFHGDGSLQGAQSGNGSDSKRYSEGVLAPANRKSSSKARDRSEMRTMYPNGLADRVDDGHNSGHLSGAYNGSSENNFKKIKLKVRIHPKSNSENDDSSSMAKPSQPSDASRHRHKLILQDNSDDDHTPSERGDGSPGVPSKDFSGGELPREAKDFRSKSLENSSEKQMPCSESVRKSKRVPKRQVLDAALDESDEDVEILYLEKLNISKGSTDYNSELEGDGEKSVKKKNISKISNKKTGYDVDEDYGSSRSDKKSRKKSRAGNEYDDADDGVDTERKKQKTVSAETLTDAGMEPLTTRQRALQSGKGASAGGSSIEFPNGLPPPAPRKQKEKLSEVEQQAKKAEAAQRRRMQVEKAARESEAEAIRKILGQDSNRKKKEEKLRKERDERAQKKAAESLVIASNSIRWVMGPTGTIVTFGEGIGLPSIFGTPPPSYPPPREKCAAPLCTNSYKYRDSKLNLPLCSLQCYKAVRESCNTISTC